MLPHVYCLLLFQMSFSGPFFLSQLDLLTCQEGNPGCTFFWRLKGTWKKWIFHCWWIPVSLHLLKTKVSLTFQEKGETRDYSGSFLPIFWKGACEWALCLLSIISCSDACKVPGSFWCTQEKICIQYWSTQCLETVTVPLHQEMKRCFSSIYWNSMF